MLYYEVAVLGASLKPLTYSSNFKIPTYQIVSVPIKSSVKSAVILREVAKPSFKTKGILEISQLKFSPFQIALANFIAYYYVCEKGVAFGIFEPASDTAQDLRNSQEDPTTERNCACEQISVSKPTSACKQTSTREQNFISEQNSITAQNSVLDDDFSATHNFASIQNSELTKNSTTAENSVTVINSATAPNSTQKQNLKQAPNSTSQNLALNSTAAQNSIQERDFVNELNSASIQNFALIQNSAAMKTAINFAAVPDPAHKQNLAIAQNSIQEQDFTERENSILIQNSTSAQNSISIQNPEIVQTPTSPLSPLQIGKIPSLTPAQEQARKFAEANGASLIFGDTGSGKSEIYIALIAQALAAGKQALFLMPEISLTPQMTKRLQSYFGERLGVWHSKISPKKKREILAKFNAGEIRLIAGARSALFLPFSDLGLIVVDEEHDDSYKSAAAPRLNARDAAIFVGKKLGIRVVLGSATPALSTYAKQPHFRLRGTYFSSAKRFIFDESETGLSPKILTEIGRSLEAGKQAVVFLPTRANYKYMVCENCGQIVRCPFCAVGMSYHADAAALKCHYCGFSTFYRASCENCGGEVMQARKIGTGELAAQLAARFPSARIAKFDRDEITTQRKLEALLNNFNAHKIDILVGTQMLSKGHDYHGVDLAVIMGIDEHLSYPDFRAREKTLALAMQVAGRAGRSGQGRVVIQTRQSSFFRDYIENYDDFLRDEAEFREGLYPPYMRLLRVLISHKNEKAASEIMNVALELLRRKQAGDSAFASHDGLDARQANLSALNLQNSAQQSGKQISNFKFQSSDLCGDDVNLNRQKNASNLKNNAQISARYMDGDVDSVNLKPERNEIAQNFINLSAENLAGNSAQYLKEKASESFEIIGYGKACITYIASKFRFEILLRASSHVPLINAARALEHLPVEIDMDPVNFG
ncbi:primosomal protein N' [uncultured Campylobacter sp.]|uniref:replication restart helicase PriA n=1 Tax=uncultured Campylobacter sp. TaxID=218934 RepID=UPI00261ED356|nr:primosomal protein N' [uncultured Campylobacter sp.]